MVVKTRKRYRKRLKGGGNNGIPFNNNFEARHFGNEPDAPMETKSIEELYKIIDERISKDATLKIDFEKLKQEGNELDYENKQLLEDEKEEKNTGLTYISGNNILKLTADMLPPDKQNLIGKEILTDGMGNILTKQDGTPVIVYGFDKDANGKSKRGYIQLEDKNNLLKNGKIIDDVSLKNDMLKIKRTEHVLNTMEFLTKRLPVGSDIAKFVGDLKDALIKKYELYDLQKKLGTTMTPENIKQLRKEMDRSKATQDLIVREEKRIRSGSFNNTNRIRKTMQAFAELKPVGDLATKIFSQIKQTGNAAKDNATALALHIKNKIAELNNAIQNNKNIINIFGEYMSKKQIQEKTGTLHEDINKLNDYEKDRYEELKKKEEKDLSPMEKLELSIIGAKALGYTSAVGDIKKLIPEYADMQKIHTDAVIDVFGTTAGTAYHVADVATFAILQNAIAGIGGLYGATKSLVKRGHHYPLAKEFFSQQPELSKGIHHNIANTDAYHNGLVNKIMKHLEKEEREGGMLYKVCHLGKCGYNTLRGSISRRLTMKGKRPTILPTQKNSGNNYRTKFATNYSKKIRNTAKLSKASTKETKISLV